MRPFGPGWPRLSLAAKIAAATSVPILAVMVVALLAVNFRVADQVNRTVSADLARAAFSFESQMVQLGRDLERIGAVVTKDPKFFAMLTLPRGDRESEDFRATLYGVVSDFQRDTAAPVFDVMDEHGVLLARGGYPEEHGVDVSGSELIQGAIARRPTSGYMVIGRAAYRVAAVPIVVGGKLVGILRLGRSIDAPLAQSLKETTRSDVVFTVDGEFASSTLPDSPMREAVRRRIREWREKGAPPATNAKATRDHAPPMEVVPAGGERLLTLRGNVEGPATGGDLGYVLLRSLDQETLIVKRIGFDLYVAGAAVALLALGLGLLIAAGITRPIRRLVQAANEMRVGNYDFPIQVTSRDEMGALAADFEAMRAAQRDEIVRLEDLDRMKSNFITIASHEIVTPATTIRAYADMMSEGSLGLVTPQQRDGLSAIRRATETLARLARDLTNMSLIDRKELPASFGSHDVGEVLEEVGAQIAPLVAQRNQHLTVGLETGLVHPRTDRAHLAQAILNLAMNAIRFTPDGGSIELAARRVGEGIEIAVSDTGIGIPAEDQGRIFSKLVELKDVNLHSSGTVEFNSSGLGLGLSIARGIVETLGGTIGVESEVGKGSTFRILLPLPIREAVDAPGTHSAIARAS